VDAIPVVMGNAPNYLFMGENCFSNYIRPQGLSTVPCRYG